MASDHKRRCQYNHCIRASEHQGDQCYLPYMVYLNDNNGNIASLASSDYVNYCHQKGMKSGHL